MERNESAKKVEDSKKKVRSSRPWWLPWAAFLLSVCGIMAVSSVVLSLVYFYEGRQDMLPALFGTVAISSALTLVFFRCTREGVAPVDQPRTINPDPGDYDLVMTLANHADKLNWERLYYFLVFNSIMFLACTSLLVPLLTPTSNQGARGQAPLLGGLVVSLIASFLGALVSIAWGPIAIRRGIAFQNFYMKWARRIEQKEAKEQDRIYTLQDLFSQGATIHFGPDRLGRSIDEEIPSLSRVVGAREMMAGLPWLFVAAYLALFTVCLRLLLG